ncbi:MAG: hypothetical protein H0T91_11860 [Propionibacteriaceae bacterium]|nr:hypothetical protein [Propionibacteriaceae bacterium]
MTLLIAGVVGLLGGLHAASWGAFKDTPFEGFRLKSYLRSVVLAALVAVIAALLLPHLGAALLVLTGVVYAIERFTTEWWKAILREQDQGRYTIPMRLGFRGRPINRKATRYAAGAAVGLVVVVGLFGIHALQLRLPAVPTPWVIATVGGLGGWATAFGGAWKDAPIEGFSGWKFLRSPAVATLWAVPLSFLTDSWVTLLLAAGGFAVASIETYKTFLTGGRPPGKFAGRPVSTHLPTLRSVFAHQHAVLWMVVAATFAVTLAGPLNGLSWAHLGAGAADLSRTLLAAVAVASATLGALVIYTSGRLHTSVRQPSLPDQN